jgi:hypothetical protein
MDGNGATANKEREYSISISSRKYVQNIKLPKEDNLESDKARMPSITPSHLFIIFDYYRTNL